MEKLSKSERQAIRSLMQDGRFTAVEKFFKILKQKYQEEQVKAETEFLTIWNVSGKEAKIEAIDNILNGLIQEAANDNS